MRFSVIRGYIPLISKLHTSHDVNGSLRYERIRLHYARPYGFTGGEGKETQHTLDCILPLISEIPKR